MKYFKIFRAVIIILLSQSFFNFLQGSDIIDIGELSRDEKETIKTLSIRSSSPEIEALAKRAFSTHGGFKLVDNKANFILKLEPLGNSELGLTVEPTIGNKTHTAKLKSVNLNHAILKACDIAVNQILGTPGFFSGKITFVGNRQGNSELYSGDLFFKSVRQLTQDKAHLIFPKWSPDGTKIIYTSFYQSGFPDIFILDTLTGEKKTVAAYSGTNVGGVFSPKEEKIAMILSSSGNPELYIANSNGHNPKRLTQSKGLKAAPCWSPDGKKIYFSSDSLGAPQIHVIDANGEGMKRIPTNISKYCDEPVINPLNHKELAFTAATSGTFQIVLYDFDTQQSRFITKGHEDHLEPCWLNDGRHLITTRRNKAVNELYVIDSKTGKESPLHSKDFGNSSMSSFIYQ